jgi:pSer/pThr/pTyr-binding forkhead associated (FHA) protein
VFPLKELMVIGRANDCDISLAAAHLSRRHAQLQVVDGMLFVKDLGSANGTFLNGQQVTESRVRRGDELRFDALTFGVMGPADDLAKTSVRKVSDKTPDSKPEPKSVEKATRAQRPVPPTRASSPHPKANKEEDTSGKGRLALIFLGVLAVVVITVLIFTRK